MAKTDDEILQWVRKALHDSFNLDPRKIRLDSNLFTDLGLDSIDEMELAQHMQAFTGHRLKPEEFKVLCTVQDVVESVHLMLQP